ncbi:MAG TPA: uridine kinase [Candidatus Excrementavichristensenella intestinipullorum]|nr:uridine kinase [Candidatus Excrementavichristensenella intestinipullorum]
MLMIGICGASGSGKSTLAAALAGAIQGRCVLLAQDSYYKNHPDLPFSQREKINYDEPDAFEHDLLLGDLKELAAGRPITRKAYDYAQHLRCDSPELIQPADVLILEGIHCFYDAGVRDMLDFKIYIRVDPDICLLRRVKRDILKRGRQIEGIAAQYLSTVKPMYDRYIRGYIDYADVIVAGGGKNKRIVDILATYINSGKV